jgi:hypothetical protein
MVHSVGKIGAKDLWREHPATLVEQVVEETKGV